MLANFSMQCYGNVMNTNMYLLCQSMLDSHIMNFLHLDPPLINFNQQLPKILTQASMHQLGLSFNALYNPHFGVLNYHYHLGDAISYSQIPISNAITR
jgi:hypothetical protein